jgi:hypothetical protein
MHRREILTLLKKNFPEYFEGRDIARDLDDIARFSDRINENIETGFIDKHFHPEHMPLFEFEINVNE